MADLGGKQLYMREKRDKWPEYHAVDGRFVSMQGSHGRPESRLPRPSTRSHQDPG